MRALALAAATACGLFATVPNASARVAITVDLASQTMHVAASSGDYDWPISSARPGFRTPRGTYAVQRMETMHRSRKYHNSPMPHSLFFTGGYAIHGTYDTAALGRPASHGCVRIAPGNAAALFQMVRAEGASISIVGSAPERDTRYAALRTERRLARAAMRARFAEQARGYVLRGGYVDPSDALGYAPVTVPSVDQWIADPAGY